MSSHPVADDDKRPASVACAAGCVWAGKNVTGAGAARNGSNAGSEVPLAEGAVFCAAGLNTVGGGAGIMVSVGAGTGTMIPFAAGALLSVDTTGCDASCDWLDVS